MTGLPVWGVAAALALGPAAATRQDAATVALERKEKRARAAYERDDYAVAAIEYEDLWDRARVPKYLYNAGLAREGLGHSAHALALWSTYLQQPDLTPEERARAEARAEAVRQRTTRVIVAVHPTRLAEVSGTLEVRYVGPSSPAQRTPLTAAVIDVPRTKDRALEIFLDPGTWELKFEPDEEANRSYGVAQATVNVSAGQSVAKVKLGLMPVSTVVDVKIVGDRPWGQISVVFRDGMRIERDERVGMKRKTAQQKLRVGRWEYEVQRRGRVIQAGEMDVGPGGEALKLKLVQDKKPWSAEQKTRLRLAAGLGGAGVVLGAAGAVILITTQDRMEGLQQLSSDLGVRRQIATTNDLSAAGAGMVGATLGLWTGAVTGAIRPSARRAWWIELGVGGAALGGGIAWHVVSGMSFASDLYTGKHGLRSPSVMGGGLAGLGAGLMGSGIVGLAVHRFRKGSPKRYSLRPSTSPRFLGVQFAGEF